MHAPFDRALNSLRSPVPFPIDFASLGMHLPVDHTSGGTVALVLVLYGSATGMSNEYSKYPVKSLIDYWYSNY